METAYQTDIGKQRSQNQDRVEVFKNNNLQLAIVTDGIGGNQSGDVAAEAVVKLFGQHFNQHAPLDQTSAQQWFKEQVMLANKFLLTKSKENDAYQGMGTTLVAFLIFDDKEAVVANIGDSRGYIYHDGLLTQITDDHSLVNELVKKGDLSEKDAMASPQNNIITRAIGISEDADVDVNVFPLSDGDQILLCTDGLSKMVTNESIHDTLANNRLSLGEKCSKLIKLANKAGGPDNVTVLISQSNQERH